MPELPRIVRQPATFGRQAETLDYGGDLGLTAMGAAIRETADAGAVVADAAWTARADRALAEASIELANAADALGQDTDWQSYEQRIQQSSREIIERYQKGLGPPKYQGEFGRQFGAYAARVQHQVRARARELAVDQATADLDVAGQAYVDLYSRTSDPQERAEIRTRWRNTLAHAVGAGVQSAEEATRRELAFDEAVDENDVRRAIKLDPIQARKAIEEGELGRGLSPNKREQWIDVAEREAKEQERAARDAEAYARARAREAEQDAREAARKEATDLIYGTGLTPEWLAANREALDAQDYAFYSEVLRKGGRASAAAPFDQAEYDRLRTMQYEDPEAFAEADLDVRALGPKYNELAKARQAIREGKRTGAEALNRVVQEGKRDLKIPKGFEGVWRAAVERDVADFEAAKRAPATPDELLEIRDGVYQRMLRPGLLFGHTIAAPTPREWLQGPPAPAEVLEVEDVPAALVPEIRAELERVGLPVSAETIREAYRRAREAGAVK
jgi:hypothetical protein